MNTSYLISTFNCRERLFSISGHALSNRRSETLPMNFESEIFSYMNDNYWGSDDVKVKASDKGNLKFSEN